ncbi:hypothetical protein PWT90_04745 [Aphanocladium album]|nr:hypothetical protein PWT90_04745 [Aphanocladium album]
MLQKHYTIIPLKTYIVHALATDKVKNTNSIWLRTMALASYSSAFATDDVYPTGRLDNAMGIRKTVFSITLRFDDVLEPSKLHAALCTLLDMGDWRRLGGRLRSAGGGEKPQVLTIHVPRPYTASRPPVAYSHADFRGVPIMEHELGMRLPKPQGKEAVVCAAPEDFREFAAPPELPDTVQGFLVAEEDRPLLSLRITSFADATLVAVAVPHVVMDAMALGELMRAWSLVLAGRTDEVSPVVAARVDITYDAADPERVDADSDKTVPWVLQPVYLTGFSFLIFVLRLLWSVWTEPPVESRSFYLPRRVLEEMRAGAVEELAPRAALRGQPGEKDPKLWVSEGDVLFAWACRIVSLAQGNHRRTINAHNAMNLRNRLPETTPPRETPGYEQGATRGGGGGVLARNLIALSYMPVLPSEARGPLGLVARKYRAALTAQSSPVQVRQTLRAARACVDGGRDASMVYGVAPVGELLTMTNWIKADLAGVVDFGPAVVAGANVRPTETHHQPGRIVYLHGQLHARSPNVRNAMGAVGKDLEGNMWLAGYFAPRTWDVLQKELTKLNQYET